jgi:hypothetical protein
VTTFGPWAPGLPEVERVAQLRTLAALACAYEGGPRSPLVVALQRAEHDPASAARALALLQRMPSRRYRRLIATFGALSSPARG